LLSVAERDLRRTRGARSLMRRLGVIGWPVAHSRSPAMFEAAFCAGGMEDEWSYQRLPIPPPLLAETVRALAGAGFVGANVTIPHKQAALALADRASPAAHAIGAANTLSFGSDGVIAAENTDAPGLLSALRRPVVGLHALVLGAGGSARAAVWALLDGGAQVSVWNRTPERARTLAHQLGARAVEHPVGADVLVNCTSVGLEPASASPPLGDAPRVGHAQSSADVCAHGSPPPAERMRAALNQLQLDADQIGEYAHVVDLVYSEGDTPLIAAARQAGVRTVDGLEVLVAQGALSFELWTGREAPLAAMRQGAGIG
jgi:shikimate dehydrogenase